MYMNIWFIVPESYGTQEKKEKKEREREKQEITFTKSYA